MPLFSTFGAFLLRMCVVSDTFLSVVSVRFFPRVGHGVGQTQITKQMRGAPKERKYQSDCPFPFIGDSGDLLDKPPFL